MFCSSFMMTSPSDMFGALVTKVMTEVKNLFEKVKYFRFFVFQFRWGIYDFDYSYLWL